MGRKSRQTPVLPKLPPHLVHCLACAWCKHSCAGCCTCRRAACAYTVSVPSLLPVPLLLMTQSSALYSPHQQTTTAVELPHRRIGLLDQSLLHPAAHHGRCYMPLLIPTSSQNLEILQCGLCWSGSLPNTMAEVDWLTVWCSVRARCHQALGGLEWWLRQAAGGMLGGRAGQGLAGGQAHASTPMP